MNEGMKEGMTEWKIDWLSEGLVHCPALHFTSRSFLAKVESVWGNFRGLEPITLGFQMGHFGEPTDSGREEGPFKNAKSPVR